MPVLLLYVGYMTVLGLKEYSNAPEFGQSHKQGRQRSERSHCRLPGMCQVAIKRSTATGVQNAPGRPLAGAAAIISSTMENYFQLRAETFGPYSAKHFRH